MTSYEDMQNDLKHFGKKVIDILCDCYCDLLEEHYYRDLRAGIEEEAGAAGWIRVDWRGTEYTIPIGINYDMAPAICFDLEGDHWEDETHAWMYIASRTFDLLEEKKKVPDRECSKSLNAGYHSTCWQNGEGPCCWCGTEIEVIK